MADWVIWSIVAAGLAVGEILTPGLFFLGPVALAAAVAAVAGAVGLSVEIQVAVFVLASIASLGWLRPIARRHMRVAGQLRTGTSALIGQPALVMERVDAHHGQVKIGGEVWTARPYDDDDVFEPGQRVDVMKIDGATALVAE
jgi:membrane protein implicated in regulation of membrane protease activity